MIGATIFIAFPIWTCLKISQLQRALRKVSEELEELRVGNHGTNIAEISFWRDRAADIRYTYGPKKE